ncbi:MAG: 50S ribosomal protein L7/L12 [Pirellulaceae bacterium]|jgi:large subunit ribosomal protein L7/L12|nr:50S ribosomal protein L7/L12 [Pirellulaceae bacterium]
MSEAVATKEFSPLTQELGDKIADLTLKQAKELSDYLKDKYGIEPAAGGGVIMAAPAEGGPAAVAEKTEFDVVLTGFGDKKLNVVKVVKNMTGASLMDAKKLVEGVPATLKQGVSKEEAEKMKAELEEAGGSVELK